MGISAGDSGRGSWCTTIGVFAGPAGLSLTSMLLGAPLDSGLIVSSRKVESSIAPRVVSSGGGGNCVVLTVSGSC